MERDFLGLGSKSSPITIKEETSDASKDLAPMKSSGMQLSFANKVSAIPQFLSFKAVQEDKSRNLTRDPLVSTGYMSSKSTADAFDTNQKSYPVMIQKSKQVGNHYPMTSYTLQHLDAQGNHPQEVRMFPVPKQVNQAIVISMNNPLHHSQIGSTGHSVVGAPLHPQPLGGVPVVAPLSMVPSSSSVIGTTDLRNTSKPNGAPAQLTIFYNGSVCVYDDVSPEKAQAIMLLAGNGLSTSQNKSLPMPLPTAIPTTQGPTTIHGTSMGDHYAKNNSHTPPPCSGLSSPISVTSHVVSQSVVRPSCNNDLAKVRPTGALASSGTPKESPKPVGPVGASTTSGPVGVPATSLVPAVAVPQARKASLARFLEKRKERVMSASPYSVGNKSPDSSNVGTTETVRFSVNSSGCLLPAVK